MIDSKILSLNTGVDPEISELICEIEEKYGHEVHMVIEPIFNNNDDNGFNWWVEFKNVQKALNTFEDVKTFFLEGCDKI